MTQKRIRELEAENERLRRQVESLRPATHASSGNIFWKPTATNYPRAAHCGRYSRKSTASITIPSSPMRNSVAAPASIAICTKN